MNLNIPVALLLVVVSVSSAYSQRNCVIKENIVNASVVSETGTSAPVPEVIIIPVVVHVIYHTAEQNISNDQVRSQIAVLNADFRKKNTDAALIPVSFRDLAADSRIEFRLATIDPTGFATNGIIRKQTSITAFAADDNIKSSENGGQDAWDRNFYLNIWVGNLSGGVMGYSSLPGCSADKDGVVISYNAFGTTGNLKMPYTKGRTAVHEIGHWLGLRHIWGDADCGDDKIEDTPPQLGPTRGCPSGVISTCSSGAAGNMYMNFMDFTNDECTSMFTVGQTERMRELFSGGGARNALLYSDRAVGAVEDVFLAYSAETVKEFSIYPNPAVNVLHIRMSGDTDRGVVTIYNQSGQVIKSFQATRSYISVDVSNFKSGMYYIKGTTGKGIKFIKG